jgi:hypothetical protein
MPNALLLSIISTFERAINDYLFNVRKLPPDLHYDISGLDLIDMILRVDKRIVYFQFFHRGMLINEAKKVGLFVYWLVKFKPIRIIDSRFKNQLEYIDINECFAFQFLYTILKLLKRDTTFVAGGQKYWDELRYSLRFRNFTLDSMMVLADSFH